MPLKTEFEEMAPPAVRKKLPCRSCGGHGPQRRAGRLQCPSVPPKGFRSPCNRPSNPSAENRMFSPMELLSSPKLSSRATSRIIHDSNRPSWRSRSRLARDRVKPPYVKRKRVAQRIIIHRILVVFSLTKDEDKLCKRHALAKSSYSHNKLGRATLGQPIS